jgi:hypothetical protein
MKGEWKLARKVELAIAEALGLMIPHSLLVSADEVIQ